MAMDAASERFAAPIRAELVVLFMMAPEAPASSDLTSRSDVPNVVRSSTLAEGSLSCAGGGHAVHFRHHQIHYDYIRHQLLRLADGNLAIVRLAYDFNVAFRSKKRG